MREHLLCLPDGGSRSPLPPSIPSARGAWGDLLLFADREDVEAISSPEVADAVDRAAARPAAFSFSGRSLSLSDRPLVMGILNVTPDSFSDGGMWASADDAVSRAGEMIREGADLIDVGGESTRPGSRSVPPEIQLERILPVLRGILSEAPRAVLSVDTTSSLVAGESLRAGASIVNDTSALADDPGMASVVARHGAAVVLMHRRGTPATMQEAPSYRCFMKEMVEELEERARLAISAGIPPGRILLDPGIGFGKRPQDNLEAHRYLGDLCALGHPVVFASSRKGFLGAIDRLPAPERGHTSLSSAVVAALNGASILRVHDVAAARRGLDLVAAVRRGA